MQWLLQPFEDTETLAAALDRLGLPYTWHKVVPFTGDLIPEPVVPDPDRVVMFGSYALWRFAEARGYRPGVFRIRPFAYEAAWEPYLLNGPGARFLTVREVPGRLAGEGDRPWFVRPVDDSKAQPGRVMAADELVRIAEKVLALAEDEIPRGSLAHDTALMLCPPARILKEWRVWVVEDRVVTVSLFKEGRRVTYRREIDEDARLFAEEVIRANPGYASAYVLDLCRTKDGLRLLETNCVNAAGFYAADAVKLAMAVEGIGQSREES